MFQILLVNFIKNLNLKKNCGFYSFRSNILPLDFITWFSKPEMSSYLLPFLSNEIWASKHTHTYTCVPSLYLTFECVKVNKTGKTQTFDTLQLTKFANLSKRDQKKMLLPI